MVEQVDIQNVMRFPLSKFYRLAELNESFNDSLCNYE